MANINVDDLPNANSRATINPDTPPPTAGKIADTIGTGDNAKDSIVYLTIRYSFIAGCIISVLVTINEWCFRESDKVPDIVGDIKNTWTIVIPVITLALGYAFGKSSK